MIEPFVAAFILALISEIADKTQLVILGLAIKYKSSEIADKTQLVILGLAIKYKSPFRVFSGALLAHAVMDGIAIALGAFSGFSLSSSLIKNGVGVLFVLLGIWAFVKLYFKKSKKADKKILSKTPLITSFLTVLLSEFGDKTQIASGLLAAKYLVPIPIFIGFVSALAIVIGLNVFVGSKVAEKIPRQTIKIVTAILFILFGMFTLLF
ncbi:MAG: TMEM165/GDT1 family protein [Candidatus Aenigmarchaeota archaeon]|nr:TMEM165/GDT1 family protein [Candidatus Aenigmarchaeota archaeon]